MNWNDLGLVAVLVAALIVIVSALVSILATIFVYFKYMKGNS